MTPRRAGVLNVKTHGRIITLRYKGEVVEGRELGEEKATDLGRVRYYGESPGEMSPWEQAGWHLC